MTIHPIDRDQGSALVLPFRSRIEDEQPAGVVIEHDSSYEVALDDEPASVTTPTLVDQVPDVVRRPIVPTQLRGKAIVPTAKRAAARSGHVAGYHTVRSPWYFAKATLWAMVGVFRLIGRGIVWWWQPDAVRLEGDAANANDAHTWAKVRKEAQHRRLFRFYVLAGVTLTMVVLVASVVALAPWWLQITVVLVAIPLLAWAGKPKGKRLIAPAVVKPRYRKLNADIVLNALYRAGLGNPDKDGLEITFGSPMARDASNTGTEVIVNLPQGYKTIEDAVNARGKIASGLDVALTQVYISAVPQSHGRFRLFVADVDPLSVPAGRTPLLDCKVRDIWKPAPLGLNERSEKVALPLIWTSVLIGAQPRKGKTFTARQLALYAALDPYVRLSVFDAKGSPDWIKFNLVAYSYGFGMLPDRVQGDPVDNLLRTLREAKKEVQTRNVRLRELPTAICPEGKLTRDIARDRRYKMPVWVIVIDEFQDFLNTGDDAIDNEVADLMVFLVKQGPSTGVIFVDATQRPSGVGSSGKVAKKFTDFRDNHQTRFALKTGSWQVSELVLGAGSYSEGYDSSVLPVGDGSSGGPDFRGIGILYNAPIDPGTVRTYRADGKDAERILHAARKHREAANTLDGMAGGDTEVEGDIVDPVDDALSVMLADESRIQWEDLAARLAETYPHRYEGLTKDAISRRLTGLGTKSVDVRKGGRAGTVQKGVLRAELEQIVAQRAVSR